MTRDTIRERDLQRFRRTNIGQPLIEIAKDFQRRVLTRFAERGHTGLQPAHTAVITNLNLEGTRFTALARHASLTQQGTAHLVDGPHRVGHGAGGQGTMAERAGKSMLRASSLTMVPSKPFLRHPPSGSGQT